MSRAESKLENQAADKIRGDKERLLHKRVFYAKVPFKVTKMLWNVSL